MTRMAEAIRTIEGKGKSWNWGGASPAEGEHQKCYLDMDSNKKISAKKCPPIDF